MTAVCVISHWILDLLVHRPDLPITPRGGLKVGLGLWSSLPATLTVELLLFGAGIVLYARCTKAKDRFGTYGLWGLVGFLLAMYVGNLFGPLPPSTTAVAWTGQAQWLIVGFAFVLDRHRSVQPNCGGAVR